MQDPRPHVSCAVSLFLLSQVFLIIHYPPLVRQLADIILNGDLSVCSAEFTTTLDPSGRLPGAPSGIRREFAAPEEPLAQVLDNNRSQASRGSPRRSSERETFVVAPATETLVGALEGREREEEEEEEGSGRVPSRHLGSARREQRHRRGFGLRVPSGGDRQRVTRTWRLLVSEGK